MGRVSEVAIGASALAGIFYVTVFILGFGFSIGTQIIIARLEGEKKSKTIGPVFMQSLVFLLILALVLFLFLKYVSPAILHRFISSEAIYKESIIYIQYRSWGILPGFITLVFRAFFVGIANTKVVTYITIVSALSNLVLNYIFVFGHYGATAMGIGGTALASSLSEIIALFFAIAYTFYAVEIKRYNLFSMGKRETKVMKSILPIAIPIMFQIFISLCSWFIFFAIIEQTGSRALAISNLVRNVYMILMIPLLGFSAATNTLVSNIIGQNRTREVFSLVKKIILLSFFCTLILVIVNLLKPDLILSVFTNDILLIQDTLPLLYIISGSILCFSIATIFLSAVSGRGDTKASLIIESVTIAFYLFATYIFAVKLHLKLELIWCVEYVYFLIMGSLSYTYLKRRVRKTISI